MSANQNAETALVAIAKKMAIALRYYKQWPPGLPDPIYDAIHGSFELSCSTLDLDKVAIHQEAKNFARIEMEKKINDN